MDMMVWGRSSFFMSSSFWMHVIHVFTKLMVSTTIIKGFSREGKLSNFGGMCMSTCEGKL